MRYGVIMAVMLLVVGMADAGAALSNAKKRDFNEEQWQYWQNSQTFQKEMGADLKALKAAFEKVSAEQEKTRMEQEKMRALLEKQIQLQQQMVDLLKQQQDPQGTPQPYSQPQ